jgi:hypothetical protein
MKILPEGILYLDEIKTICLPTQRYEDVVWKLFPSCSKVNHQDFDFKHEKSGCLIEVKKQKDIQWFDLHKFYHLSPVQIDIIYVFLNIVNSDYEKGVIETINCISLGELLNILKSDKQHISDGWTDKAMADIHFLKKEYPSLQLKVKVHTRNLINKYSEKF